MKQVKMPARNNKGSLFAEIINNKAMRKEAGRRSFKFYCLYYHNENFKYPTLAPYHHVWMKDFEAGLNMFLKGHRDSAKTTILAVLNRCRKITYRKKRFLCNLCYDKRKAKQMNKIIINILMTNTRLREDFGVLFDKRRSKISDDDLMSEKGVDEFVTTNRVKVKAFGMGEAVRGEIFYTPEDGILRPDDLLVDDIDNNDNTKNTSIIDDDMEFMKGEVFGGLQANSQIVWLGNTIRKDGRNPRMEKIARSTKGRVAHINPIYDEEGSITWDRYVETDAEAEEKNKNNPNPDTHVVSLEKKRRDEGSGFAQNRELKEMKDGEKILRVEWLTKISKKDLPVFDYVNIGGDPAFSLKKKTDGYGIVVTGIKIIDNVLYYYILRSIALYGEEKREANVTAVMKHLYEQYGAYMIRIERNNGGEISGRLLQEANLPVDIFTASKDKLTRTKEYEAVFMSKRVFIVEEDTYDLVDQYIDFTGEEGNRDDLVDAMINSFNTDSFYFHVS